MKDKLVRYNHKAGFYIMKKFAIGASVVVFSSILVALPISLGLNMVKAGQVAKTEPSETSINEIKTVNF
jgi:hypothetical protein